MCSTCGCGQPDDHVKITVPGENKVNKNQSDNIHDHEHGADAQHNHHGHDHDHSHQGHDPLNSTFYMNMIRTHQIFRYH